MPQVLQKIGSPNCKAIFTQIYSMVPASGVFELRADQLGRALRISERTIYRVIAFLVRMNLLKPISRKTGRGNHSVFKLNWLKSEIKSDNIVRVKIKTHTLYDGRTIERPFVKHRNPTSSEWGHKLKAFRLLLSHSWLMPSEQRLCLGVLGRHVKNRSIEYARQLYHKLAARLHMLDVPNWVRTIQDLSRWWMGVLKSFHVDCLDPKRCERVFA